MIGLMCVLLVGSCVAGMRGCARISYNPTVFSETVREEPVKTRRMLADYLETATYEAPAKLQVRGRTATAAVQNYTDSSLHLTLDGDGKRLVEVVAHVTGDGDESRVEVISDATGLAVATRGDAPTLHRRIHGQIERALDAIDHGRPLAGGFSMARLIKAADRDDDW